MSSNGGFFKLVQQQDVLLGEIIPAFVAGTKTLDYTKLFSDGIDDLNIAGLIARLSACLSDMAYLMSAIEDGYSQSSVFDPDQVATLSKILVAEIRSLSAQIRETLSRSRARSRL
ncbi:hypothetical protein ACVBEF_06405 [Glaciimonas sp. GG7]